MFQTAHKALYDAFTPPKPPLLRQEIVLAARAARHEVILPPDARFGRGGGETASGYVWGDGDRTVLLAHGWGGRSTFWGAFVDAFLLAGYRVAAIDSPAHGESTGTIASGYAYAAAMRVWASETPIYAVIGHSWGAFSAAYAIQNGFMTCERAVFLAPLCDVDDVIMGFMAKDGASPDTINDAMILFAQEYSVDERTAAHPTRTPLLILTDEKDPDLPVSHSRKIAAAWPNAHLQTVAGVGHNRILRAKNVVSIALAFLSSESLRPRQRETL